MDGTVKKEYTIKCDRRELENIYKAIKIAVDDTPDCSPLMDSYKELQRDIEYILEK